MNQFAPITRHTGTDVTAPLTFIVPQDEKPSFRSQALTGGAVEFLFDVEEHQTLVADLRPYAENFTLDEAGFAFRYAPTAVRDLYDDDTVEGAYFDEIENLLKTEFSASEVVVFDATRRSDGGSGATNRDGNRGPASRIHVDYTAKSGPQRARGRTGCGHIRTPDRLGQAGWFQVNVWRPIVGPVQRSPLALADANSIAPEDLIATDQVFPNRVGEIYHLAHNPTQRWYYASGMTADEVLLIKGWDSVEDGRAQYTPHSAFALPDQDGAPRPRKHRDPGLRRHRLTHRQNWKRPERLARSSRSSLNRATGTSPSGNPSLHLRSVSGNPSALRPKDAISYPIEFGAVSIIFRDTGPWASRWHNRPAILFLHAPSIIRARSLKRTDPPSGATVRTSPLSRR